MGEKSFDRSFAGGELTPEMYGRADLGKYQTGLALCRNAMVLPHGPVVNRPGTEYVNSVKNPANAVRLIPFTFSFNQTMVIEMGAGYFRFHTQGATLLSGGVPYEIANTLLQSELFDVHYVQSADVMTLVHPAHPIQELRRLGPTSWTLTAPAFTAPTFAPTSCTAAATVPHAIVNSVNFQYVVTAVKVGDLQESVVSNLSTVIANDLTLAGNFNVVSWVAPVGITVIRYNVYRLLNGLFGYIGQSGGLSFVDNNITPDSTKTPPIFDAGFNDATGNYPGAVSYYQQRRCFAGTLNAPQNVWMTMSGTESNMGYTIPTTAQNRVSFRIAAREASGIRHLVPVANLVMLTPSNEWRVASTDGSALQANNLDVRAQSYIGANNVNPVVVGNAILFSQSRGGRIREMAYNWQAQAYLTNDISVLAPHLFDYNSIVDMTFSRAPYPILYAVSSNGSLLGMTYVPEQQVAAWFHHDFSGFVETVTSVTEQPSGSNASEDMVYIVVNRTINGAVTRSIERMHTRYYNTASDAFFVDSGASNALPGTYTQSATTITINMIAHGLVALNTRYFTFSDPTLSGTYTVVSAPDVNTLVLTAANSGQGSGTVNMTLAYRTSTISGLTWLANQTVNILADGAVIPQQVVDGSGNITLPYPATKVVVGLPITTQIQTLPLTLPIDTATGETLSKNIDQVWLRLYRSSGVFVGPDFSNLTLATQRAQTDPPGSPPALFTGVIPVVLTPEWTSDGQVCVQQTDPLPMTLVSVATDTTMR